MTTTNVHANVQDYYGKKLHQSKDLKTDACYFKVCLPKFLQNILSQVHSEVKEKYYGCGLVFPPKLEGCHALDLGCGSGRDVYILSSLVGPKGHVVGVDMTQEQLDVANSFIDYHTKQFGYEKTNVEFCLSEIEHMTDSGMVKTNSFDVVVSNCVVCLTPDKKQVLQQVYQVLKPGGEFYFSDMYCDRIISEELRQNKNLWGEGLSGSIRECDLVSLALEIGFTQPVLVTKRPIQINNQELLQFIGENKYAACTYRMFKAKPNTHSSASCGLAGALVTYEVPITHFEDEFKFDEATVFKLHGEPRHLNPELANMLALSRYAENFKFKPIDNETQIPKSACNTTIDQTSTGCCRQGACNKACN